MRVAIRAPSYLAERKKAAAENGDCLCRTLLIAGPQMEKKSAAANITFPAGSLI
jgi:hypothetical protein